jgi:hypothetical protein
MSPVTSPVASGRETGLASPSRGGETGFRQGEVSTLYATHPTDLQLRAIPDIPVRYNCYTGTDMACKPKDKAPAKKGTGKEERQIASRQAGGRCPPGRSSRRGNSIVVPSNPQPGHTAGADGCEPHFGKTIFWQAAQGEPATPHAAVVRQSAAVRARRIGLVPVVSMVCLL